MGSSQDIFYDRLVPPHSNVEISTPLLSLDISGRAGAHRSVAVLSSIATSDAEHRKMEPGGMVVLRRSALVWEKRLSDLQSAEEDTRPAEAFVGQSQVMSLWPANQKITTNIRSITVSESGESLGFRPLRVSHKTKYVYSKPVNRSVHTFRLSPVEDEVQEVQNASITFSVPTKPLFFMDSFGNRAIHLTIEEPYSEFTVLSEANVKIYAMLPDDLSSPLRNAQIPLMWLPWQRQMMLPYLLPPEFPETQHWELSDYAMSFVERNDYQLLETLDDINRTIYTEYSYQSGSTTLGTTAYDVYINRTGVCQDFANLFICLARILNVPARYCMGYIYTGGNYENKIQSDASHAWVEVYLPFIGWRGYDPTNGCLAKQDHIRIAYGRNYIDSTPTSGTIYKGGGKEILSVEVKVEEWKVENDSN